MSSLRREKWKVNLKLKRFRTVFNREHITAEELVAMAKPPPYKGRGRPPKRPQVVAVDGGESSDDDETQDGDGDGDDLVTGEDLSEGVSPEQSDEELPSSRDTLETRIKQMRKVHMYIYALDISTCAGPAPPLLHPSPSPPLPCRSRPAFVLSFTTSPDGCEVFLLAVTAIHEPTGPCPPLGACT